MLGVRWCWWRPWTKSFNRVGKPARRGVRGSHLHDCPWPAKIVAYAKPLIRSTTLTSRAISDSRRLLFSNRPTSWGLRSMYFSV